MTRQSTPPTEPGAAAAGVSEPGLVVDLLDTTAVSLQTRRAAREASGPATLGADDAEEVLVDRPIDSPVDLDADTRRRPRVTGPLQPAAPGPADAASTQRHAARLRTATERFEPLPPADARIATARPVGFWAKSGHLLFAAAVGLALGVGGALYAIFALQPGEPRHAPPAVLLARAVPQPRVVSLAPRVDKAPEEPQAAQLVAALADAERDLRLVRWLSTADRERMLRLRLHIEREQWEQAMRDEARLPRYLRRLAINTLWGAEIAARRGDHAEAARRLKRLGEQRSVARRLRVRALLHLSASLRALGDKGAAKDAAARALAWARRSRDASLTAAAQDQLARCVAN